MKAVWKGKADFAQIAEAIGCDTGDIMAAMLVPGEGFNVLYTTGTDDPDTALLWTVMVKPDADDILVKVGEPVEVEGGLTKLWEELGL